MVPDRQKVWTDRRTDGRMEWTDGRRQNYIPPTSSGDNKRLYMAFVILEKAFDRVPQKVIWWALRKLGVEEWIVQLVQGMSANARSRVLVGKGFSQEFEVNIRVHQGSVLSPLLFII